MTPEECARYLNETGSIAQPSLTVCDDTAAITTTKYGASRQARYKQHAPGHARLRVVS